MNRAKENHVSHTLASTVADGVRGAIHAGTERLNDVAESVTEKYEAVTSGVKEQFNDARAQAERVKKNVEDTVRTRPLTSLLVIGGIGFLLGVLCRRR